MNSAKVSSVVALASATTVAAFMALMIFRGNMPIIQMAPFIGLNGAIVGGLSTSASTPAQASEPLPRRSPNSYWFGTARDECSA